MKVLFLDIDGVLNNKDTNFKTSHWPLDRYMGFMIGKIQLDTDCHVVLSSSWRHHPEGIEVVEKHVVKIFDTTPTQRWCKRGEEIQEWLDEHPEVTRYAIVDDDTDMLESQLPNFFPTTFETGLTEEIAARITKHLNS